MIMFSRRRAYLPLAGLFCAALAGCASPDPTYYTLASVPGPTVPGPTVPGPTVSMPASGHSPAFFSIELRRPGIAGYLDRAEIVQGSAGYQLAIAGNARWGEPFGDMVGRVLARDLSQRLPGIAVFTEAGAISSDADLILELDVQRFDTDANGAVVLAAQVALSHGRAHSQAVTRGFRFTVPRPGPGTAQLAAAMSALLGQLADAIAPLARASMVGQGSIANRAPAP